MPISVSPHFGVDPEKRFRTLDRGGRPIESLSFVLYPLISMKKFIALGALSTLFVVFSSVSAAAVPETADDQTNWMMNEIEQSQDDGLTNSNASVWNEAYAESLAETDSAQEGDNVFCNRTAIYWDNYEFYMGCLIECTGAENWSDVLLDYDEDLCLEGFYSYTSGQ
jgi:hypothetical protein